MKTVARYCCICLAALFVSAAALESKAAGDEKALVTLDVQNADIRAVCKTIVSAAGLNVVFEDGVKGKVTAKFEKVLWSDALDAVLSSKNLVKERKANIIYIKKLK